MLTSDIVGILAGAALAYPALKDQFLRYKREREKHAASGPHMPRFHEIIAKSWEEKRVNYDGIDSLLLAAGGLGLIASFILKACEL